MQREGAGAQPVHDWQISGRRLAFDRAVEQSAAAGARWFANHWLLAINTLSFVLFALPVAVAPVFLAWGWNAAAGLIFAAYSPICHQMPSRSFFLFGQQMAFCQRNAAIFGAFLLFGLLYTLFRRRLRPLPTWLAVTYSVPIAVDGFTQLFGWRESTWELRLITGGLFGLAAVWYVFPHLEMLMTLAARRVAPALALPERQGPSSIPSAPPMSAAFRGGSERSSIPFGPHSKE